MNIQWKQGLLVTVLSVLMPVCGAVAAGGGVESKTVTVVGKATGAGLKAEEEATLNAQRRAVEQVCGAFINSMTKTKNYQTVYDKILSQATGFARVVRVIETEKADGLTYVKAEIEVFPATFRRKWAEFAHIKEGEDNPRCVLIVVEDDNTTDDRPPRTNGVAQSELEGFFIDKDVQLMDKGVSDEVRMRDLALAAINDDVNKVASAGAAFKAEVVVLGQIPISKISVVRFEATPTDGVVELKVRTTNPKIPSFPLKMAFVPSQEMVDALVAEAVESLGLSKTINLLPGE